jgi:hypothetical protein
MKQLLEMYNEFAQQAEDYVFKYVLPPFFKVILFGMKVTLAWAFYQTLKNVANELF